MRLKNKALIIKYASRIGIKEQALKLLLRFMDDSYNCIINNYSTYHKELINSIFGSSETDYYSAYLQLHASQLIKHDATYDTLVVMILYRDHLYNLIYELKVNSKKGKYVKEPIREQQGLIDILSSGKIGSIIAKALYMTSRVDGQMDYVTKSMGIKVPEEFMPYLKCEPLSPQDRHSLLLKDKERLYIEDQRRNLNKEDIRTLCACMAFFYAEGEIEDFNRHALVSTIIKEFGDKSFCVQTFYNSIDKLIELKLIEEYFNYEKGCTCLRSIEYKNAFEKSKSWYVIVPNVVLRKAFKKLQLSGIKLFFDFVFQLNNGENKDDHGNIKYSGQDKAIFFKIALRSLESAEKKASFAKTLSWLRKRYPNELRGSIFGDLSEQEFKALGEFFHFHYNSETSVQIRIRKEYFISKQAEKLKQLFALSGRYKNKARTIEIILKDHHIDYTVKDLVSFVRTFKKENKKSIAAILGVMAERIKKGKDQGWKEIDNLGGYVQSLYHKYRRDTDKEKNEEKNTFFDEAITELT